MSIRWPMLPTHLCRRAPALALLASCGRDTTAPPCENIVGELSCGTNVNAWLWPYALPREAELSEEFKKEMAGTDISGR